LKVLKVFNGWRSACLHQLDAMTAGAGSLMFLWKAMHSVGLADSRLAFLLLLISSTMKEQTPLVNTVAASVCAADLSNILVAMNCLCLSSNRRIVMPLSRHSCARVFACAADLSGILVLLMFRRSSAALC
jgi:hypothetical protein